MPFEVLPATLRPANAGSWRHDHHGLQSVLQGQRKLRTSYSYNQSPLPVLGAVKSAAHWASYLVRDGHVNPHNSVQIGIRGNPRTLDWLEPSYDLGYEVIDIRRLREIGVDAAIEIINQRIGDEPVYITFDLDAFDTTVAPGVANLEAGIEGLFIDETMKMLRSVRGKNIIGGDVVCLMPTKDAPNKQTALVAMSVMFEMISLIADAASAR